MLVTSWFFGMLPRASGITVDGLSTCRRQLAYLHLFGQCMGNVVGFASSESFI